MGPSWSSSACVRSPPKERERRERKEFEFLREVEEATFPPEPWLPWRRSDPSPFSPPWPSGTAPAPAAPAPAARRRPPLRFAVLCTQFLFATKTKNLTNALLQGELLGLQPLQVLTRVCSFLLTFAVAHFSSTSQGLLAQGSVLLATETQLHAEV